MFGDRSSLMILSFVTGTPGVYTSVAAYLNFDLYDNFLLDVMKAVPDSQPTSLPAMAPIVANAGR